MTSRSVHFHFSHQLSVDYRRIS